VQVTDEIPERQNVELTTAWLCIKQIANDWVGPGPRYGLVGLDAQASLTELEIWR